LLLALACFLFAYFFFVVLFRYKSSTIAGPLLLNAVCTAILTVVINTALNVPPLAALIGVLVGIVVGALLCRLCGGLRGSRGE
jgi:uncharacterized membrane protein